MVRPNLASITPDYGYYDSDGCYPVILQGNHLGTSASAKIGDAEITNLAAAEEDPDIPEQAQDVGFKYTGFAPASPSGEPGWFDVTMTVDDVTLTIKEGWYYKSCAASFILDAYDIAGTPAFTTTTTTTTVPITVDEVLALPGDAITMEGCGLTDQVSVVIIDPSQPPATPAPPTTPPNPLCTGLVVATLPIEVDCPAAIAHATLTDDILPGNYFVKFVHSDGYEYVGECGVDSGDTGLSCDCIELNMGGAK